MPIKALDYRGDGTEQDLGEGILYAVRKGAKIVVLSVGLHRQSPYMQDIVQYAENQGVLLVAAAGNDGVTNGEKANVKYPAAYPTVIGVGGVRSDNRQILGQHPGLGARYGRAMECVYNCFRGQVQKRRGHLNGRSSGCSGGRARMGAVSAAEALSGARFCCVRRQEIGAVGLTCKAAMDCCRSIER